MVTRILTVMVLLLAWGTLLEANQTLKEICNTPIIHYDKFFDGPRIYISKNVKGHESIRIRHLIAGFEQLLLQEYGRYRRTSKLNISKIDQINLGLKEGEETIDCIYQTKGESIIYHFAKEPDNGEEYPPHYVDSEEWPKLKININLEASSKRNKKTWLNILAEVQRVFSQARIFLVATFETRLVLPSVNIIFSRELPNSKTQLGHAYCLFEGFDPTRDWHIALKTAGYEKLEPGTNHWFSLIPAFPYDPEVDDLFETSWLERKIAMVLSHEIGHCLGLQHRDEKDALMNSSAYGTKLGKKEGHQLKREVLKPQ